MIEKPFLSVVNPLYNKEKYIKRTLESALQQIFTKFEIIKKIKRYFEKYHY